MQLSTDHLTVHRSLRVVWATLMLVAVAGCESKTFAPKGKPSETPPPEPNEVFSTPLQRAIARGTKPNGDLAAELSKLDNYPIKSRKDAKSICQALSSFPQPSGSKSFSSPLHALTALFQDVEGHDAPAFEVLYREGLPQLIRIYDAKIDRADEEGADDLLMILKILAMYGSPEGAEKIIEAARRPLKPDGYMWHVILSLFSDGHPERDLVFDALRDPLPPDFIGVALLDSANGAAIKGELPRHPFDSSAGHIRLQRWLQDSDPNKFSYAHSATAALPFISNPPRDQLLALAMDHSEAGVQMEAAWAAGKLGREAGLKILGRFCQDVNHSDAAQRYLAELGREDVIPPEVKEPSFQAKAELAQWLAHPNELGRPPDELEIVDHRTLAWPPEREPKPMWLIRYLARDRTGLESDDVDCGLVGSTTWCFFTYRMHERPPEDVYAIHCYWELEHAGKIQEVEVTDPAEYARLLAQWQGAPLQSPAVTRVAELSPDLKAPGRLVALSSAMIEGDEGWVVLDGSRSTWYPKSEQPDETSASVILKIHVGRQLLGFQSQPDRKKFLVNEPMKRDPAQLIAAYEKLMEEATGAKPDRQQELLGSWSLLSRHFDAYVDALSTVRGTPKQEALTATYEQFLHLAENADESVRDKVRDVLSVVGEKFESYVDALVSAGRAADVETLVEKFEPHWDNNLGHERLADAAFKIGKREFAERYLQKVRGNNEKYHRSEAMSRLAEIWHERGEVEKCRELLLDCMRKLVAEIKESEYNSDRKMFAEEYQHHRATYLRLFPAGADELTRVGLPSNPL